MAEQAGRLTLGVFFGGRSAEHEISIVSARSVVAAVDRERFDPVLVGIDRQGRWFLHDEATFGRMKEVDGSGLGGEVVLVRHGGVCKLIDPESPRNDGRKLDVVFPVLHGTFGEDGTIQGLLDFIDLPYVGAGVIGSAVGMDKDVQKRLLRAAGVPVVDFEAVTRREWETDRDAARARIERLGSPVFVKPANLGSSVGISRARGAAELDAAMQEAFLYDLKVVVEREVKAREIECSVLGNDDPQASLPGEIVPGEEFYSYDDKYSAKSTARLLIPAPLPEALTASLRSLAVRAYRVTECLGMARVDFFLERDGERLYVNELNTIPGFTSISMYPKMWEATGLSFAALVTRLIELALERHAARAALKLRP
jgi:D-alanine-D-alanine ligase